MTRAYSFRAATRRSRSPSLVHQPTDARTSPVFGMSRTTTPAAASRATTSRRRLPRRTPGDDASRALRRDHVLPRAREQLAALLGHLSTTLEAPFGTKPNRGQEPAHERGRHPVGVEAASSWPRLECAVRVVRLLREVARPRDPQPFGIGDDQGSGRLRPTEPFLTRDRQEVEAGGFDWDRAHGLRSVDQDGIPVRSRSSRTGSTCPVVQRT